MGSALGFLRIGVTIADLRDGGTIPKVGEKLTIAVIRGVRGWMEALATEVGSGSR